MVTVDSASAPRRRQPEVTRDKLLAAAVDLFAERGYDRVRVRDIAERAGVTTGAIYSHYPDMATLLADAAGRAVDHAVEAVADVAPGELSKAMLETATSTSVGRRLSREQALLLEALVAARREPTLQTPLSQVLTERLDVLERAVVHAQRAGELRTDLSPHALAWFLYLAPIGLLAGRAVELPGPELGELVEVLEAAMVGLRAQPAEPAGTTSTATAAGSPSADGSPSAG